MGRLNVSAATQPRRDARTVGGRVDGLGELSDGDFETSLNELEDFLVWFRRDKGDGESLGPESTGTSIDQRNVSTSGEEEGDAGTCPTR